MADDRIPELVTDLQDQVAARLTELKIDPASAHAIGVQVAEYITSNWGGQLIYIPKNHSGQLSARDLEIWDKFNGRNHAQLAKEYNLTVQHVYRVVKMMQERENEKRQNKLFPE